MKVKTTSTVFSVLAIAAALTASGALAQQSQPNSGRQPGIGQSGMVSGNKGDQCRQMMAMRSKMMADMKAVSFR